MSATRKKFHSNFFKLALIILLYPLQVSAESFSPPDFNYSRYLEDYSYLKDETKRTGLFDSIKYMPLDKDGEIYLSLGGETRQHYENVRNGNWGATPNDDNGYYLQRYMFHGDLHIGKQARTFVEFKSGIESGRAGGPRGVDEDKFDLHQAFFDYKFNHGDNHSSTLRVGRQELIFGARRFVNYRERPNVRLSFDGAKLIWEKGLWNVSAFATKPVEVDPGVLDDNYIHNQTFWGLYTVRKRPQIIPGNIDLYYLGLERDTARFVQGTDNELRHSFGTRWWDKTGPWDYNFEFIYQIGKFGKGDINAFTFASDTGYTLKFPSHKVRLSLRGDISSGDDDPNDSDLETFNLHFAKGKHLGQFAPYGPVNLMEIHPKVDIHILQKYKVTAMWEFLWRQSVDDGIYSIGQGPLRTGSQSNARYVGNQAILEASWQIDRHLAVRALSSYFFAGTFLKETPPGEDIGYLSGMLTYKF